MTTTWYVRDRHTEFYKVLRRQTVQTLVQRRAQSSEVGNLQHSPLEVCSMLEWKLKYKWAEKKLIFVFLNRVFELRKKVREFFSSICLGRLENLKQPRPHDRAAV